MTSKFASFFRRLTASVTRGEKEHPGTDLSETILRAEKALRRVELPGYRVDIVSAGLVRRLRISRDGAKILVVVDYKLSDPGCSFCRFIGDTMWMEIIGKTVEELRAAGFKEVVIADSVTGAILYPVPTGI